MEKFLEHIPTILAVLFGISEALAYIPQVKSNSVFQASFSFLKKAKEFFSKPKIDDK